jgi:hypothetical protein
MDTGLKFAGLKNFAVPELAGLNLNGPILLDDPDPCRDAALLAG